MGSGSLNAITVLETKYRDDLSRDEAIDIAAEAIEAGIFHDLGSGSHVDYLVITRGKSEMFRNARKNQDLKPLRSEI